MNPLDEDDERWPDEPEEFDPDSLGPETPDIEAAVAAGADVDEALFRAFWGAAIFLNIAVAAIAIGMLLVYFRGDWTRGGGAILVGLVAAAFTARFYLDYRPDEESEEDPGEEDPTDGPETEVDP